MRLLSIAPILALATLCSAVVGPGVVKGNVNPVADPTMCKSASGEYFVFCERCYPRSRMKWPMEILQLRRREYKSVLRRTALRGRWSGWFGLTARAGPTNTLELPMGKIFDCSSSVFLFINVPGTCGLLTARSCIP
jgi:hypothetical protein